MASSKKPTPSNPLSNSSQVQSATGETNDVAPGGEAAAKSVLVEAAEASPRSSTDQAFAKRQAAVQAVKASKAPAGSSPARYISFIFLLGVIGLVGIIFYWVMAKFIIPLFLAALLVVIFRPVHGWILDKTGGRDKLAAALTTISILLAVLVPLALLLMLAAAESRDVFNQFSSTKILKDIRTARQKMKLDLPNADQVRDIDERLLALQLTDTAEFEKLKLHGTNLFEISQSASKIAEKQNLKPPGDDDQIADPNESSDEVPGAAKPTGREAKWTAFCNHLGSLRTLQRALVSDMDPNSDKFNSGLHDYRALLDDSQQTFTQFKYDLMGGKTRAFAIELLNPSEERLRHYSDEGRHFLQKRVVEFGGVAGSIIGSLVIGTAIMLISLYFFLLDGPAMVESFKGLSPLEDEHEQELVGEFGRVSRAVVVATLLSALAQGLLAGIGFYFVGLDSIFLLTLLSAVLAMVPFVGAAAVWIPCSLYLYFFTNNLPAAIGLAIYGVAVIPMADNFIKPYILHGETNLHPLLALLSVIGGVAALGPIGILIGPMVVVFLQTLLKILQRELSLMEGAANVAS